MKVNWDRNTKDLIVSCPACRAEVHVTPAQVGAYFASRRKRKAGRPSGKMSAGRKALLRRHQMRRWAIQTGHALIPEKELAKLQAAAKLRPREP